MPSILTKGNLSALLWSQEKNTQLCLILLKLSRTPLASLTVQPCSVETDHFFFLTAMPFRTPYENDVYGIPDLRNSTTSFPPRSGLSGSKLKTPKTETRERVRKGREERGWKRSRARFPDSAPRLFAAGTVVRDFQREPSKIAIKPRTK